MYYANRDSAVGIATANGLDGRGVVVRVPVEARFLSSSTSFRPVLGPIQPPLSTGVKRQWREADRSPTSEYVDLYIHSIHLHGVVLKHRDNFTFTYVRIMYIGLYMYEYVDLHVYLCMYEFIFAACVMKRSSCMLCMHVCMCVCRGTWIAQSVQRRATGSTAEESGVGFRQGQEMFLLTTASRPVLGLIQGRIP
jgi:hypothetical protein